MNELDYAIMAILLLSLAIGAWRGGIREIINIGGWVVAFILAHAFSATLAPYFADWMADAQAVAAVLLLVAVIRLWRRHAGMQAGGFH